MEHLKINRTKPVQENFMGCNAVYHGYAGMPDDCDRVYNEEQCELEADRIRDLGVKIVRTYYKWWAWSREGGWNWENDVMKAFYRWCERMQKRGIEIAIHGGWCLIGDITGKGWGGDCPFSDNDVSFEEATEKFAEFVSESLHQLIELRGFTNIKYLMLFTESEGHRKFGDDCYAWETASRAVHNRLVADGRRNLVKLVGPNENIRRWNDYKLLRHVVDNASDFIDIFGAHFYVTSEIPSRNHVHSGDCAVCLQRAGARVGQYVEFKPNTTYELSGYARVISDDYLNMSGVIQIGAFIVPPNANSSKGAAAYRMGRSATSRLTVDSVKTVDPAKYKDSWFLVKHTFKTEEGGKASFGFLSDIQTPATVYVDDLCLCEEGNDENLLKNPSFEDGNEHWDNTLGRVGFFDSYTEWYDLEKVMISVVGGKPFWHDEYNNSFAYDKHFTDKLHGTRVVMGNLGMMNAGASSTLLWTAFDQQWPNLHSNTHDAFQDGVHRWGLMPVLTQSKVPYPGYYAFRLLARHIGGEGTKIFAEEQGAERLHLTLSEQPDGTLTVVVASMRPESTEFSVDLGKDSDNTFYRRTYDPETLCPDETAAMLPIDKTVTPKSGIFKDIIPAYGVAVYRTKAE